MNIKYSLSAIHYCLFPIGYTLLAIPYWLFPSLAIRPPRARMVISIVCTSRVGFVRTSLSRTKASASANSSSKPMRNSYSPHEGTNRKGNIIAP